MFGPPGTAYVYRSYGVHWCLNVAVEGEGTGAAVLLRAAVVVAGGARRAGPSPAIRSDRDLLRGPGNLCRGLAIDAPAHDGGDLVVGVAGLRLADDGWRPEPGAVAAGPRVGVSPGGARPVALPPRRRPGGVSLHALAASASRTLTVTPRPSLVAPC
jgi:DNA-3-methyladenine glycosylase